MHMRKWIVLAALKDRHVCFFNWILLHLTREQWLLFFWRKQISHPNQRTLRIAWLIGQPHQKFSWWNPERVTNWIQTATTNNHAWLVLRALYYLQYKTNWEQTLFKQHCNDYRLLTDVDLLTTSTKPTNQPTQFANNRRTKIDNWLSDHCFQTFNTGLSRSTANTMTVNLFTWL